MITEGNVIPATGNHIGGTATCISKAICTVCENEYGELDLDNHSGATELKNGYEAGCGSEGYSGDVYCTSCESMITEGNVIPATGNHIGGTATCISKAICTVCENEYGELDLDNHSGATELRNGYEAGCGSEGYSGDVYCTSCDNIITQGEVIPATGNHTGGTATCTEKASCSVCGQAYGEIDVNNHVGETEIRGAYGATCGADGYSGDTYCKSCDSKITDGETIPATGAHVGGKATCVEKAICSVCGNAYGELDKNNHPGGINVQGKADALCYKDGHTGNIHCSVCDDVLIAGSVIPATGNHVYTNACDTVCNTPGCGFTRIVPHAFGGEWQKDADYHWRICQTAACGALEPKALHTYGNDNVCDVCAYTKPADKTLGDVNGDTIVNSDDAVAILRYLAGYDSTGYDIANGDYNGDTVTNSDDAVAILRMLAGYKD